MKDNPIVILTSSVDDYYLEQNAEGQSLFADRDMVNALVAIARFNKIDIVIKYSELDK